MALFQEIKDNEFQDLVKLGWLEEGTDLDAGKYCLSAKGLAAFTRLIEGSAAKDRVLTELKVAANVYKTPTEIKAYMG